MGFLFCGTHCILTKIIIQKSYINNVWFVHITKIQIIQTIYHHDHTQKKNVWKQKSTQWLIY